MLLVLMPPPLPRELIRREFQAMARAKLVRIAMIEMVALQAQGKFQRLPRPVIWSKVSIFKNVKH